MPTKLEEVGESQQQLNEIEFLKGHMRQIVESDAFKCLEGKTEIDDILSSNKEESLSNALNHLISKHVVKLDGKIGNNIDIGNEIELEMDF